MTCVLVIDDCEIERLGRATALERLGHAVTVSSWSEFEAAPAIPTSCEFVLAVVRPDLTAWDRYRSIQSLGLVRSMVGRRCRVVAGLAASGLANPLVRLRLHRSGVTEVVAYASLPDGRSLANLLDRCLPTQASAPSPMDLALVGVGANSDPSSVVEWVLSAAEETPSVLQAFEPNVQQNQTGLSRRQALRLRARLTDLGAVQATRGQGGGPARDCSLPRWSEVIAIVNLCRGWESTSTPFVAPPGFAVPRAREVAYA